MVSSVDRIFSANQEVYRFLHDMDIHKMYYMEKDLMVAQECLARCIEMYYKEKEYRKKRVSGSEEWELEKSKQADYRLARMEGL